MRPLAAFLTLIAVAGLSGSAVAGPVVGNSPATTAKLLPKAGGTIAQQPGMQQGPSLAKAKLVSLTLAQTTIPPTNTTTVVLSLQGERPVANCQLMYELRTNYSGADAINIPLNAPLDFASSTGGWGLPLLSHTFTIGTLMNNGQLRLGNLRLFLRAKDVPGNTCTGEVHADFEIKNPTVSGAALSAAAAGNVSAGGGGITAFTAITGVILAPDWYNFLKKRADIKILGKGAAQCAYVIEVRNTGTGTTVMYPSNGTSAETVLPMEYGDLGMDLAPGNYTVTVKPGKPTNPSNPNIQACTGQASAMGKVSTPPNAMGIGATTMRVTKTTGAVVTQKDISLPMNELSAIALDVNFTNAYDPQHNTWGSCAYKLVTVWPQGGSSEAYYLAQGTGGTPAINVSNPGIEGRGPGTYTLRVQGTTQIPGNNQAIPCVGNPSEHRVTLTTTIAASPAAQLLPQNPTPSKP